MSSENVTFIDEPGDLSIPGIQDGKPQPAAPPTIVSQPFDFGFEAEGDDTDEPPKEEGKKEELKLPAPPVDHATAARLATLEAQNRELNNRLLAKDAQDTKTKLETLLAKFEDAVQFGRDDEAAKLRKEIAEAQTVASAPAQAPAGPPDENAVPASLIADANAWKERQPWYGRDAAKGKRLEEVVNYLDFRKFPDNASYLAEVERQVNLADPTPNPNSRQEPAPRTQGTPGTQTRSGRGAGVTSINQLKGPELEAAQTAIRVGGITEAQYLASYNEVKKNLKGGRK